MIDSCSELSRPEEVDRVQVGNVDSPRVWTGTLRAILLDVHAKETDIGAVHLLKRKQSLGSVGELIWQVTRVHKAVPHSGFYFDNLVRAGNHPDRNFACTRLFLLEEVVHSSLDVDTQFGDRQAFCIELVVFTFATLLLMAGFTYKPMHRLHQYQYEG